MTRLLPARASFPRLGTVHHCDAITLLRALPSESVHCIVTSPPYYGLRDYGAAGQLGLEDTPEQYVDRLVGIFREARRVLRDDGTLWLNLGDSYSSGGGGEEYRRTTSGKLMPPQMRASAEGLAVKQLIGIPWRVAFALQADGWWLRSDIIWHKPNCMPESVTDRPTKAHEYVFLLSKSARYYYDQDAIAVASSYPGDNRALRTDNRKLYESMCMDNGSRKRTGNPTGTTRNKRSVWTVPTVPSSIPHYAMYPPALILPCILAGCPGQVCAVCGAPWERVVEVERSNYKIYDQPTSPGGLISGGVGKNFPTTTRETIGFAPTCACNAATVGGIVLDPFMGTGTTALVAREYGRRFMGCDIDGKSVALARARLAQPWQPRLLAA